MVLANSFYQYMLMLRSLICCCVFGLLATMMAVAPTPGGGKTAVGLNAGARYAVYVEAVTELTIKADRYKSAPTMANLAELRNGLAATRDAYKRIEFLAAYYQPAFVEDYLNGAPLLHAENEGTHGQVTPPEGLQVLDELIHSEEVEAERSQIAILCGMLVNRTKQLEEEFSGRNYSLDHLLTAARMQLIRTFTTGVTGFDTPGSLRGVEEAAVSMDALREVLAVQPKLAAAAGYTEIDRLLVGAIDYLRANANFDTFDRLYFLRQYVNPLYGRLGKMQRELKLVPEPLFPSPINQRADNLFSPDLLDPYFYTDLTAAADGPALRQLGKTLFSDANLSRGGQLSCASCHQPERAFTDGLPQSNSAVDGKTVLRNSPTLLNAVYADRYFHDLRAFTLEQQAEHVIFDHGEFDTEYDRILETVNDNAAYAPLTKQAFGKSRLDAAGFSAALASYVLSLQSWDSPFDRYVREESEELSEEVVRGFNLFMGKAACGTCHFAPTFAGLVPPDFVKSESEILGLLKTPHRLRKQVDDDPGRSANQVHHEEVWIYAKSFKTPTVRNVSRTAPYFHNGAYSTLELVVDFYDHGGGAGIGLDVPNQTLGSDSLHLTVVEKADLTAFMEVL